MKRNLRALSLIAALCTAGTLAHSEVVHQFDDSDRNAVRELFLQQAKAATVHDIVAFERVFAPAEPGVPDPVTFIARAYQFWGKPALVEHFKETFKGVWKFEPDADAITIVPMTPDTAQIYAPTQVTFGVSQEAAKTAPFLVYEVAIRTSLGWRIATIIPLPAK